MVVIYLFILILSLRNIDVLDLAWNMDDSMLAAAGIDGIIVIWNAKRFPGTVVYLIILVNT